METIQLARIYNSLGLEEPCLEVLKKYTSTFYFSAEIWATYANILEDHQDWQAMRAIALQMRRQRGVEGLLDGFSHLLEGRSELAQGRVAPAEAAFGKAAAANYDNASVGFMIAKELASQYALGYVPKNPRRDGAFRRLTVRIADRPGAAPRTRSGYIAPRAERKVGATN